MTWRQSVYKDLDHLIFLLFSLRHTVVNNDDGLWVSEKQKAAEVDVDLDGPDQSKNQNLNQFMFILHVEILSGMV